MWTLVLGCTPDLPPDQDELTQVVRPYVDPDRPTPAVGDWPSSPQRALDTWVWIGPAAGEDAPHRPLLLMLHGMGGHPEKFERFARALAEAGVVVAAPTFPVSNAHADGGLGSVDDLLGQVGDASFVLDQLAREVADRDSPLWMRFDPQQVVALGHSMGGATLLGRTRYDAEPRVGGQVYVCAATILEPVLASNLGEPLEPSGPLTLVVTGSEDEVVPPAFGEELFAALDEPKGYLGITGADHSNALESQQDPPIPEQQALIDAVTAAVTAAVGDDPAALDRVGADLAALGHDVW
jgi:dienelactone hydrolase